MEQNSLPGHINISEPTYTLITESYHCLYRGEISAKNKADMKMYYLDEAKLSE